MCQEPNSCGTEDGSENGKRENGEQVTSKGLFVDIDGGLKYNGWEENVKEQVIVKRNVLLNYCRKKIKVRKSEKTSQSQRVD